MASGWHCTEGQPFLFQSYLSALLATSGVTAFLMAAWFAVKELFLALYVDRGGGGSGGQYCNGGSYDFSRDQVSCWSDWKDITQIIGVFM